MRRTVVSFLAASLLSAVAACASGGTCPSACGGHHPHGFSPRTDEAAPAAAPAAAPTAVAPAAPAGEHGHGEHGEHGEHQGHPELSPELRHFHDILAPRWHATAGEQRTKDTCAAIPDFRAGAQAIAKAPPAGADAAAWTAGATDLGARVDALAAACQPAAAAEFEARFGAVHDGFHHMMELSGGKH